MAKKEFILQGFTARTHVAALQELFDVPAIRRVVLSVAFVSESGVEQIEDKLRLCASQLFVLAGIRNEITSYQGLRRLLEIGGELYVVDTGSRSTVFHPKVYLVRGNANARMIVGSANLTLGGLNNNIEAGMLLDFDLADMADKAFVDRVEAQLTAVTTDYPEHVTKIEAAAVLDGMLAGGRLVDEMVVPPPRLATSARGGGVSDPVPRIRLMTVPLRRASRKARVAPITSKISKAAKSATPTTTPAPAPAPAPVGVEFELVWESKPLTRRDLTIPTASNTNQTGSINLDKGLLPEEVDHRHYFRDDVFLHLTWASKSPTVDVASAKFQLVLKGINYGEYDLSLHHTNSTTSKTYTQRNAMTRLSWGPMREYVARPDLIDRTLALYRDRIDPTRFIMEID